MSNRLSVSFVMTFNDENFNKAIEKIKEATKEGIIPNEIDQIDIFDKVIVGFIWFTDFSITKLFDDIFELSNFYYLENSFEGLEYSLSVSDKKKTFKYDEFEEIMAGREYALKESLQRFFNIDPSASIQEYPISLDKFSDFVDMAWEEYKTAKKGTNLNAEQVEESIQKVLTTFVK